MHRRRGSACRSATELWLVKLEEAGEVIPVPAMVPVPLTQPWFRGLANIRGNLFSVIDFAAYQGGEPTPATPDARLLLVRGALRHRRRAAREPHARACATWRSSRRRRRRGERAWERARFDGQGRTALARARHERAGLQRRFPAGRTLGPARHTAEVFGGSMAMNLKALNIGLGKGKADAKPASEGQVRRRKAPRSAAIDDVRRGRRRRPPASPSAAGPFRSRMQALIDRARRSSCS